MKTAELQQQEQESQNQAGWFTICDENDLVLSSGVCALIPSEKLSQQQLAIFRVKDSANEVQTYAVANWDPIGKANVISRGIVGSIDNEIVVSSPLYKQHFSLLTGQCIEDPTQQLTVYETCIKDGALLVKVA
jgi:nitrite reductase (NADH) small subunit